MRSIVLESIEYDISSSLGMGNSISAPENRNDGGNEKEQKVPQSLPGDKKGSGIRLDVAEEEEEEEEEEPHEETISGKYERRVDEARLGAACNAIHRMIRLQRNVTAASIDARMNHRLASNKRRDVWTSDVCFMDEVQRLMATRSITGLDELFKLASECQRARDDLGPVEQETIEAEQNRETAIWKLRHAEDKFYEEFEDDFVVLEAFASESPLSVTYSPYRSSSEPGSHDEGTFENEKYLPYRIGGSVIFSSSFPTFLQDVDSPNNFDADIFSMDEDLAGINEDKSESQSYFQHVEEWDTGVYEIYEEFPESPPPLYTPLGKSVPLPPGQYVNSVALLLTNFTSTGNRIDRWLAYTMLCSSFEAMKLFGDIRSEFDDDVPSNWAELVVAYWELKKSPDVKSKDIALQEETLHIIPKKMTTQKRAFDIPRSNMATQEETLDTHLSSIPAEEQTQEENEAATTPGKQDSHQAEISELQDTRSLYAILHNNTRTRRR